MVGTDGRIHKRPGLPSERNLRTWIAAVLKLRARVITLAHMARLALLLKVRPAFGLFPVEPLESPTAPISMAR